MVARRRGQPRARPCFPELTGVRLGWDRPSAQTTDPVWGESGQGRSARRLEPAGAARESRDGLGGDGRGVGLEATGDRRARADGEPPLL